MSTVSIPEPPTSNHYHVPLANVTDTIVYTETDEAPALATYSLYPYIAKFAALSGIDVVPADISVAGRVLAAFPEKLKENQRVADNLAWLGEWAKTPEANIVKLPNISAPLNQMEDCIKELRSKGYDVPLYPREPSTQEEEDIKSRYDTLMGSAVSVPFTNYSFVVVCKTVGCIVFFSFLFSKSFLFILFIFLGKSCVARRKFRSSRRSSRQGVRSEESPSSGHLVQGQSHPCGAYGKRRLLCIRKIHYCPQRHFGDH